MLYGKQKDSRETINGNNLKSLPAKSGKNLVRKLN